MAKTGRFLQRRSRIKDFFIQIINMEGEFADHGDEGVFFTVSVPVFRLARDGEVCNAGRLV